jgi:DNA-binding IclR family transcriptional regulator
MTMTSMIHADAKKSVIGRVFDILECFGDQPEQTISSLCTQTGLPPATVHRMLAALSEWGAVERCSRGTYRLGMRLWRLGWGVPEMRTLKDVARPVLVDLHRVTGEMVAVCSKMGFEIVVADVIAGQSAVTLDACSRRVPMRDSAPGDVYMAFGGLHSSEMVESLDFAARQRLHEIRHNGFAVRRSNSPEGMTWLAAPVIDEVGSVRSTLAMIVPDERVNVTAMGRVLVEASRRVSASFHSLVTHIS